MMDVIYGTAMALIGLFLFVSATLRTDFVVYQLLVARSQLLWGSYIHLFFQVSGAVLVILGLLWASGMIWHKA
ncbi:hypothetical protein [Leptolyngbya iicbica]|uniref:Uncharacterized protein n=2 Tax=Cyanophyceae TaxID=3028117 RepID=A0A4Q7EAJ9_9CYAN|nr:hypothetical protein [Leptolyngbya sp. LK]RZM79494.1 hypothetical protein DYY88_12250 [Leptolyngbya sp. LK]